MERWMLLDVSALVWAGVHAIGNILSFKGQPTYVYFSFFSSAQKLQKDLGIRNVAFCFDKGMSIRRKIYPEYKLKRKSKVHSPEEEKVYREIQDQIRGLREKLLREIGFRNVFAYEGYEADDLIAQIVKSYPDKEFVIVSPDKDLYQLLSKRTKIYKTRTRTFYTKQNFIDEFGIHPCKWAKVKAMAGCATDEVCGIRGVGELTAAAYVRGDLKSGSKKHSAIISTEGRRIRKRNLPLVKLPYEGTPICKLIKDKEYNWNPVLRRLGIKSLTGDTELKYEEE